MRLSYDLFQQIISGLRADTRAHRDQRGEPRVGISCEASIVSAPAAGKNGGSNASNTTRIQVRDLSSRGIGLMLTHEVREGQQFIIELPSDDGPCWLLCSAVHCLRVETRMYRIGARHTRVLQPEEVKKLSSQMMQARAAVERQEVDRIRVAILD